MQNNLNISNVFYGVGAILCVAAIIWWASFYKQVEGDGSLDKYVPCLFNPGGECGQISGYVQMLGGPTPYSPYLLWAGILLFVIGFVVEQSSKPSE